MSNFRGALHQSVFVIGVCGLLVACGSAPAEKPSPDPAPAPTKPWRVTACTGVATAEVRIASRIPETELIASCSGEWVSGYERVTVRFDGAYNDTIVVTTTWYDAQNKMINVENTFDREFTLGSSASHTEMWDAPTPKAQRVRLDVSCTRC